MKMNSVHLALSDAKRSGKPEDVLNQLLNECPDAECGICAVIMCPHEDSFHFHHDGCPSCAEAAGELGG